jgi:hypothetical protein
MNAYLADLIEELPFAEQLVAPTVLANFRVAERRSLSLFEVANSLGSMQLIPTASRVLKTLEMAGFVRVEKEEHIRFAVDRRRETANLTSTPYTMYTWIGYDLPDEKYQPGLTPHDIRDLCALLARRG